MIKKRPMAHISPRAFFYNTDTSCAASRILRMNVGFTISFFVDEPRLFLVERCTGIFMVLITALMLGPNNSTSTRVGMLLNCPAV